MNRSFPCKTEGDDAGRTSFYSVSRNINRNVLDFVKSGGRSGDRGDPGQTRAASATPSAAAALPSAPSRVASSALSLLASSR